MSERRLPAGVERLHKQAESALAASQSRRVVEPMLERLARLAPEGSEASMFAHRHLAEYRLEDHPWRALLHLRRVVTAHPDDDVVHALMGLSHALLANFRAAVTSYRRAIKLAPKNPWYHHNLGHLLDVALGQSGLAVTHLELAHRTAEPPEHEITASFAHCLARVGRLEDAERFAKMALAADPSSQEHRNLLDWIRAGARSEDESNEAPGSQPRKSSSPPQKNHPTPVRSLTAIGDSGAPSRQRPAREQPLDDVSKLLAEVMPRAGFSAAHVERARQLWADYRSARAQCQESASRAAKAAVTAAAIEYAVARLSGTGDRSRASVARRYGVSARSVAERFEHISVLLVLKPADPRYAPN